MSKRKFSQDFDMNDTPQKQSRSSILDSIKTTQQNSDVHQLEHIQEDDVKRYYQYRNILLAELKEHTDNFNLANRAFQAVGRIPSTLASILYGKMSLATNLLEAAQIKFDVQEGELDKCFFHSRLERAKESKNSNHDEIDDFDAAFYRWNVAFKFMEINLPILRTKEISIRNHLLRLSSSASQESPEIDDVD